MRKIATGLLMGALAFGGLSVGTAPANAFSVVPNTKAVYGKPGNINCQIIRSVRTAPYERRVTWECDYRTSAGVVLKDAVRYDRIKRSYTA